MKKIYLGYILLLLFLTGCGYNLQKDIVTSSRDKDVSEKDFKELQNRIRASEDSKLTSFEDPAILYNYIIKYLGTQNIVANVWNPTAPQKIKPFNVNVFIENSASMDGYVKGVTDFENTVYGMLGSIKISEICSSLNLNYINRVIPYTIPNALTPDIQDFIQKLEPTTFQQRGGNRASSDLADVVKTVLSKTNQNNLSILISDFVFSPGSGANAQDYLNNQKVSIKINIADKINNQNLAIAIYRIQSNFSGKYFDHNNKPISLTGKRPYYVWIIGTEEQVKVLLDIQIISNSNRDVLNKVIFKSTKKTELAAYKLVRSGKIGDYKSSNNKDEIYSAKSINGEFGFSIAVNFGDQLRDESYFTDSGNYHHSDSYSVTGRLLSENERSSLAFKGYTNLLTLKTKRLINQDLVIQAISKTPSWVYEYSSMNDSNIQNDNLEQTKTFGLKYLIEGVSDAFNYYPNAEKNVISEFKIKINK